MCLTAYTRSSTESTGDEQRLSSLREISQHARDERDRISELLRFQAKEGPTLQIPQGRVQSKGLFSRLVARAFPLFCLMVVVQAVLICVMYW